MDSSSQTRTFQAYKLLVRHIPSIESKLLEMDTYELGTYFKDVRAQAPTYSLINTEIHIHSCGKEQEAHEVMMPRT